MDDFSWGKTRAVGGSAVVDAGANEDDEEDEEYDDEEEEEYDDDRYLDIATTQKTRRTELQRKEFLVGEDSYKRTMFIIYLHSFDILN